MPFELRVQCAGLCVYVEHPQGTRLGILLPDCRQTTASNIHPDGTKGAFHVPYVRMDLGSLVAGMPGGEDDDGPRYEVVHRLDRQQLSFNVSGSSRLTGTPNVPAVTGEMDHVDLLAGVFGAAPSADLVARLILDGGTIQPDAGSKIWEVPGTLNSAHRPQRGAYSGEVTWTTMVAASDVTLTLSDFAGGSPVVFKLTPVSTPTGPAVTVKLANLCAHNALEWDELETRLTERDIDFKWLYRLTQDTSGAGSWPARLKGVEFPYPVVSGAIGLGDEDCTGMKIVAGSPF